MASCFPCHCWCPCLVVLSYSVVPSDTIVCIIYFWCFIETGNFFLIYVHVLTLFVLCYRVHSGLFMGNEETCGFLVVFCWTKIFLHDVRRCGKRWWLHDRRQCGFTQRDPALDIRSLLRVDFKFIFCTSVLISLPFVKRND